LNLASSLSSEIPRRTGSGYGMPLSPVSSTAFPHMFEWSITAHYNLLLPIIEYLSPWNEQSMCSGEPLVLVRVEELGPKLVWTLTVRTPVPSSGMGILLNLMSSSMNFVEVSTLHTSSGGSIVTQSVWRSKEVQGLLLVTQSGLPRI